MYIIFYLLGLLILHLIFSKKGNRLYNIFVVVYNYLVATLLYTFPELAEGKIIALLRSLYLAPSLTMYHSRSHRFTFPKVCKHRCLQVAYPLGEARLYSMG